MTLENIKSEIITRLREIDRDADDYSTSPTYPDLKKLIARAISAITLCESAEDIEATNDLFTDIENQYNLCKTDVLGHECQDSLFEFDFELDDENDESDIDEDDESDEDELDFPIRDIKKYIDEAEAYFDDLDGEGSKLHDAQLDTIYNRAVADLESARDETELKIAVRRYRKRFKKLKSNIDYYNKLQEAKPVYDSYHTVDRLKLPNIIRLIVGGVAFLGAASYGIVTSRDIGAPVYEWDGIIYGIASAGLIYLIMSLVYAIIAAKSYNTATVRHLAFVRLVFVPIALVASLIFALLFTDTLGFGGAFIATLPLTVGGTCIYIKYRLGLIASMKKKRKEEKRQRISSAHGRRTNNK